MKIDIGKVWGWILCSAEVHDWTSDALEGKKQTKKQIVDGADGLRRYGILYCKRCLIVYPSDRRHLGH